MKKYRVEPRIYGKWLWFSGKLRYDVIERSERWEDPSYGNGCGDFVPCDTLIESHEYMIDAINHRNQLNKMEEGNHASD